MNWHKNKEEARATLDHELGSHNKERIRHMLGNGMALNQGTIEAIEMLGGKYQSGWGITRFPEEW